ncbi:CehA/McbA family metallohydrolase [Flavobacterium sp. XGLA_31]|uniref:CehA/McbA family metallohydrolase n=1 Tax=Flavobacterium sp. XGLA_31 TaxID=3447666 RepID=UPI003F393E96
MKNYFYALGLLVLLCFSVTPLHAHTLQTVAIDCAAPTTQPSGLTFVNTFSDYTFGSFTGTTANGYLVLISKSSALSAAPVDGVTYTVGDTLGNATVLSASSAIGFEAYALTATTTYYVVVYAYNANVNCSVSIKYNTVTPLTNSFTTPQAPSVKPSAQPTNLTISSTTSTTLAGSFTGSGGYSYLVVVSPFSSLNAAPVERGVYTVGNTLGRGKVVSVGNATSFTATGLQPNTAYTVFVYAYADGSSCFCGTNYLTQAPLTLSATTDYPPCNAPTFQPTALVFNTPTADSLSGSFTTTTADNYLIVYSTSASLSAQPNNGTTYTAGATLGNATVLSVGSSNLFNATGLTGGTTYYFTIFALNNALCVGGPAYNTVSPLKGSVTITSSVLHYYFGNFHSHSEYSDGTGLPSGDFAYGDAANCMDFLGISEHNHVAAGMALANWSAGRAQAAAATTPTFLALYGMEWGVISGGGHVVVYGVPDLLGWDPGQYEVYVAKNDYTGTSGLFPTINSYGNNAFATLAHPNNTDYQGIMSTYNAQADNAIVGTAVENGPSTSTNTTYSDPPSSMAYLSYYRNMLARGYHLGPTIDHDNHNVTHGHTTLGRTVVLAYSLTENSILDAMRHMRFYASEDCSAQVAYTIGTNPMGSIISSSGAPVLSVTTTTSSAVTSLKIYAGVPGSGSNATVLASSTSGTFNYTDSTLTAGSTRYYYIDITEADGKRIITSPIWYTRL